MAADDSGTPGATELPGKLIQLQFHEEAHTEQVDQMLRHVLRVAKEAEEDDRLCRVIALVVYDDVYSPSVFWTAGEDHGLLGALTAAQSVIQNVESSRIEEDEGDEQ